MTMATKHDVLLAHMPTWLAARKDKKKRGEIIRTICAAIHLHPKSVPRAMKRLQLQGREKAKRAGRPRRYSLDVIAALRDVWDIGDQCCGELLHPMMGEYVSFLRRGGGWHHSEEATSRLLSMSERTVKRHTLGLQKKHGLRRGISTTKPSSLKALIPIFKGPWKDLPPGHGQIDTVAHCGDTVAGDFIFTVNYTDSATYWSLRRAQWNKGMASTTESLRRISESLPWGVLELHPDTGSEFINMTLKSWCDQEGILLSRSEPGKKNDNMYVEERNGHIVRKYLGYTRFDAPEIVLSMNELYDILDLFLNHFKAVRRQVAKDKVGSKYVRRYEKTAMTPYARALAHPSVTKETKKRLMEEHEALDLLKLKKAIATLTAKVYSLHKAARERVADAGRLR